jgi:hypothetical protein
MLRAFRGAGSQQPAVEPLGDGAVAAAKLGVDVQQGVLTVASLMNSRAATAGESTASPWAVAGPLAATLPGDRP